MVTVCYEQGFIRYYSNYFFYYTLPFNPPDLAFHAIIIHDINERGTCNTAILQEHINGLFRLRIEGEYTTEIGIACLHESEPVSLWPSKGFLMGMDAALAELLQFCQRYESLSRLPSAILHFINLYIIIDGRLFILDKYTFSLPFLKISRSP